MSRWMLKIVVSLFMFFLLLLLLCSIFEVIYMQFKGVDTVQ